MATPKLRMRNVIGQRQWSVIRDAWLNHVPAFPEPGARPDPGLDELQTLHELPLPDARNRVPDVDGVRRNMLWEAVFLFQKCAHCHLAAQRVGMSGMHSWSMFNAYHAAYLGARGILALLGVAFPSPGGRQLLIDAYPAAEASAKRPKQRVNLGPVEELLIVKAAPVEQRDTWDAFQRILRVSDVRIWNTKLRDELVNIDHDLIARPRNAFLYRAWHWPMLGDLLSDRSAEDLTALLGAELDTGASGFLLRLACNVYCIFEQLMADLAAQSGPIKTQLEGSRVVSNPTDSDLHFYQKFIEQVEAAASA